MLLTWKDIITTVLALIIVGVYITITRGAEVASPTVYRLSILFLGVLGIAMCAFGNSATNFTSPMMLFVSILGILALIAIVYGIITGAKIAFISLSGILLLMWFLTTLRHAIGG